MADLKHLNAKNSSSDFVKEMENILDELEPNTDDGGEMNVSWRDVNPSQIPGHVYFRGNPQLDCFAQCLQFNNQGGWVTVSEAAGFVLKERFMVDGNHAKLADSEIHDRKGRVMEMELTRGGNGLYWIAKIGHDLKFSQHIEKDGVSFFRRHTLPNDGKLAVSRDGTVVMCVRDDGTITSFSFTAPPWDGRVELPKGVEVSDVKLNADGSLLSISAVEITAGMMNLLRELEGEVEASDQLDEMEDAVDRMDDLMDGLVSVSKVYIYDVNDDFKLKETLSPGLGGDIAWHPSNPDLYYSLRTYESGGTEIQLQSISGKLSKAELKDRVFKLPFNVSNTNDLIFSENGEYFAVYERNSIFRSDQIHVGITSAKRAGKKPPMSFSVPNRPRTKKCWNETQPINRSGLTYELADKMVFDISNSGTLAYRASEQTYTGELVRESLVFINVKEEVTSS